jgi:hypothetical protein
MRDPNYDEEGGETGWAIHRLEQENAQLKERVTNLENALIAKLKRSEYGNIYWPDWVAELLPHRKLAIDMTSAAQRAREKKNQAGPANDATSQA